MDLKEYRGKRRFEKTPEPTGEPGRHDSAAAPPSRHDSAAAPPSRRLFVVHEHAARRLHYDLRLELDGVLKSWAVPKGPSLDPAEKRLAVHVEDHPMEYAAFEGVIPPHQYGAGTVVLWDRGVWEPAEDAARDPRAAYESGKLKLRLEGEKLHGRWMLVRMRPRPDQDDRGDNWLFFKERDEEARDGDEAEVTHTRPGSVASGRSMQEVAESADSLWHGTAVDDGRRVPGRAGASDNARHAAEAAATQRSVLFDAATIPGARPGGLPEAIHPQLATLAAEAPSGAAWLHEIKVDGYRILCRLDRGHARLFTRRGMDWTERFPALAPALAALPVGEAWLDGEVTALRPDGHTSFGDVASALQRGVDDAALVYFVFDVLHLNGFDLRGAALVDRKAALVALLASADDAGDSARRAAAGEPASARPIRYLDHLRSHGDEFLAAACDLGLEGVVSKRVDATYRPGRGRSWLKVKCMRRQELVVGGFTDRADARGGIGALVLGVRERPHGPLGYAGRVGTGWDQGTMADLRRRLEPLEQALSPFAGDERRGADARGVHWVRPELVVEVEYLSWDEGGCLRHPSFEGIREDKSSGEVIAEMPAGTTAPARKRATRHAAKTASVAGVPLTNPDRVLYPDIGLSKLDLARYYESVAPLLLPFMARRPLTIVRCPQGYAAHCFFQKHWNRTLPEELQRVLIPHDRGSDTNPHQRGDMYLAVDSLPGLISLVQLGVLELHVWGSTVDDLEHPDQLVFDLDPDEALPWSRVTDGARLVRVALEGLGLSAFVKTTGGKGLHVVSPLRPSRGWDEVKELAKGIAQAIVRADPERYVTNVRLKYRPGKVLIDYLRNGRGATAVAAYSTRRRPGAPVSMPLRWEELGRARPGRYTVANARARLSALGDNPWAAFESSRVAISDEMVAAVAAAGKKGRSRTA
jgi:bifunctional non-homologous end joining protein LigD